MTPGLRQDLATWRSLYPGASAASPNAFRDIHRLTSGHVAFNIEESQWSSNWSQGPGAMSIPLSVGAAQGVCAAAPGCIQSMGTVLAAKGALDGNPTQVLLGLVGAMSPMSGSGMQGAAEIEGGPPRAPAAPAAIAGLRTVEEAGIQAGDAARIQSVASRTRQTITVIGSRANGTATASSDWDYVLSGPSKARHSAERFLPRGPLGSGSGKGIDVVPGSVDPSRPHVIFNP